jgi:hypothetical protein
VEHLAGLRADLHCERCKYNLRGLEGSVVICPECGMSCDVEAILSRKWEIPWHKAPGLKSLATPVAAGLACSVVASPVFTIISLCGYKTLAPLVMLLPLAAWVAATVWVVSISGAEAGWAAAGVTILAPAYTVSILFTMVLGLSTVACVVQSTTIDDFGRSFILGVLTVLGAGMFVACRRADIAIARWCIRRHLDGKTVGVRKS